MFFSKHFDKWHYGGGFQNGSWGRGENDLFFLFTHDHAFEVCPDIDAAGQKLRVIKWPSWVPFNMKVGNEKYEMSLLDEDGFIVASRFVRWFNCAMKDAFENCSNVRI